MHKHFTHQPDLIIKKNLMQLNYGLSVLHLKYRVILSKELGYNFDAKF